MLKDDLKGLTHQQISTSVLVLGLDAKELSASVQLFFRAVSG
jgi:hypothetical protein